MRNGKASKSTRACLTQAQGLALAIHIIQKAAESNNKEIIRAWRDNPEEILTKDALMRGNTTETSEQTENHQLSILAGQLKQLAKKEVSK